MNEQKKNKTRTEKENKKRKKEEDRMRSMEIKQLFSLMSRANSLSALVVIILFGSVRKVTKRRKE